MTCLPFRASLLLLGSHTDPLYQGLSAVQQHMVCHEETVYVPGAIARWPILAIKNYIKLGWFLIIKFYLFHGIFLLAFRRMCVCCPLALALVSNCWDAGGRSFWGHRNCPQKMGLCFGAQLHKGNIPQRFSLWPHCHFRTTGGLHCFISVIFLGGYCISRHPLSISWAVLPRCRDEHWCWLSRRAQQQPQGLSV